MVKGVGITLMICLSMMTDFVVAPQGVEPHSYVAIADGHKGQKMANVYAGFYDYDDATVECLKQRRVSIVLSVKPGNCDKRDSQIVLITFLQKVMFDERITIFEHECFNPVWREAGVSPDQYQLISDSLLRMVSCMVRDEQIVGLCGETRIAKKRRRPS